MRVLLLVLFALGAVGHAAPKKSKRPKTIAFVADGPWVHNKTIRELIQKEILALTRDEVALAFPEAKRLEGDWTPETARKQIDTMLADPEVDLLITTGFIGSHVVGHLDPLPKPVVASLVIDASLQGLPRKGEASGRKNLAYLTMRWDFDQDLEVFDKVVHYKKLAVLGNQFLVAAMPSMLKGVVEVIGEQKAEVTVIPVGFDLEAALKQIPEDCDAVYIAPLIHLGDAELDTLVAELIRRKLPSFSVIGRSEVERGVLMSNRPASDIGRLARRAALNVQQILIGEAASEQPVDFTRGQKLTINMATARATGRWPSWEIITEAELLNRQRTDIDRKLTLTSAVREALAANRDLESARATLEAARFDRDKARARLLPSLSVEAGGVLIDEDRAAASLGNQPELSGTITGKLTQLLYNDGAWAALDVEEALQKAREGEQRSLELDVALATATAYFNVLRAKTFERIQRANLKVTRSNLDLAQVRERIGSARASEVYRWEAQLANDRQSVIAASTQLRQARISLNQLTGRPQEELFIAADPGMNDPDLITSYPQVFLLLDNPWTFGVFRDFMVQEALRQAPELVQLQQAQLALELRLRTARRGLWLPTVALSAEISQQLFEAGEGTEAADFSPDTSSLPMGVTLDFPEQPEADDTNWFVGLILSLPLYSGGARYAEIRQAGAELLRLQRQAEAVAEKIEQRVRIAVHASGSTYPRIRLSREAAAAAGKSLKLVQQAYARGAVSTIELIDAQNAARVSDQLAENAVYDFLASLMQVHRATGNFFFLAEGAAKAAFMKRFIGHMAAANGADK